MLFNPDEFEPLLRQAQKYAEQQEKAQRDREEESRKIREAHYKRFGSYYLGDFLDKYPKSKFTEIFHYLTAKRNRTIDSDCYGAVIFGFFAARELREQSNRSYDFQQLLIKLCEISKLRFGVTVTLKEIISQHLASAGRFKSNSRYKGQRYYDLLISLDSFSENQLQAQLYSFMRGVREAYETKGYSQNVVTACDPTDGMLIVLRDYLKDVWPTERYTVKYKL